MPHMAESKGTSGKRAARSEEPEAPRAEVRERSSMEWICSAEGMWDAATVS